MSNSKSAVMKKLLIALALILTPSFADAAVGVIYVDTGGSAANSGTSDANSPSVSGTAASWTTSTTTITLDTNTSIGATQGCTTGGSCDGSQAIFLTNATNTNQKIFWLASNAGCTGTGACTVTVTVAPTCATCTAQAWAIGGRYLFPSGSTVNDHTAALRAGDTLQFNNTPASRTVNFVTSATAGDATTGFINMIGKAGVSGITLATTGNVNTIVIGTANWYISNLTFTSTGTSTTVSMTAGDNMHFENNTISGSGSGSCLGIARGAFVHNSDISGCGGSGIVLGTSTGIQVIQGNYIHGVGADGIIISSGDTTLSFIISNNIISGNTGRGINVAATSPTKATITAIYGNTIYGNGNSGIEVAAAAAQLQIRNNIVVSTTTAVATMKWVAGNAQLVGQHGYNVVWNSVDSNSGVSGYTLNATEVAGDPTFTGAGSANFAISGSSPAAGAGYPSIGSTFQSSGSTGYLDIGAVQRQVTAGGGGGGRIIGGGL